jgi:hypothetical protein
MSSRLVAARLAMFTMVAALVAPVAPARAGNIVLESYTGERPADAPRLLSPVLDELAARNFAAGDSVARMFEAKVSRAPQTRDGLPPDFAAQIDRGFKAWVAGRFEEAITTLVPLVEAAHGNAGVFARDQSLREPLLRGLIALALAYQRHGDPSATRATFGEILRSFPDTQLARATYGPDAHQRFEDVRREVLATGRGKLAVRVTDETSVIFVNETYRGVGSSTIELVPGEYRVVVVTNKQPSRTHRVSVPAGGEATLVIDARYDLAIRTTGWTGLAFATQDDRDTLEATFASRFANQIGATAIAVVGIDTVRDRPAVVGALVSLQTGREIRRASIPIEPDPSTDRLRALARFLAGEAPAPGLDVQFAGAASTPGSPSGPGSRDAPVTSGARWGGWRFLTAGLALAALGTGGVLIGLDGRCSAEPPAGQLCSDLYTTTTPGLVALGGGVVFAGLSIYLFATHPSGAYVAPAPGGGAVAGFTGRF